MSEHSCTYRLQINAAFDLNATADLASYLYALGVNTLYCSPYLQAAPGSTHGYAVVDHSRVDEEWGGDAGFKHICTELKRHRMSQIIDIVPNHMAIGGRENPWWWDVLENGPSSPFASFFDVDWELAEQRQNIVLLHVLGDHYGLLLEAGELRVVRDGSEILVRYRDRSFPVAPRSIARILRLASSRYISDRMAFIADALADLPAADTSAIAEVERRHRDRRVLLGMLADLIARDPQAATAIDSAISGLNSDRGALHEFLERQNYRLAFWRVASSDLGYRRFFDINSLAALRMEDERVFRATHALPVRWIAQGFVNGLRVDHPDGLRDPAGYFALLHESCPNAWIIAEKILARDEKLPADWKCDGTTGYDFLNLVLGLLIDPAGEAPLTRFYEDFTGECGDFTDVVREKKIQVMRESLGGDINLLTARFFSVCQTDFRYRDFTRHDAQEVLRSTLACLSVYRTYARPSGDISEEDKRRIVDAIEEAKRFRPDLDPRLFDYFGLILTLQVKLDMAIDLAMRFQQTSAAAMAKGVEDTAFYNFNRFLALNEVGGDPAIFGVSPSEFYSWCRDTVMRSPRTMLSTSTHDTKRSEDVRARLAVLSEIPERWEHAVRRWSASNQSYRTAEHPDLNFQYHLYQTIVGVWPIGRNRLFQYCLKAAREAKAYTSWNVPDERYERALECFVDGILRDEMFIREVSDLVNEISTAGRINSLAQTLIKLTAPGIPDLYQGTELWNFYLVDPDNRRPVDFSLRRQLLAQLQTMTPEVVMERADEGLPKLWLIKNALALRNRHLEWFGDEAGFEPLTAEGSRDQHVVAYKRGSDVIALVPRLTMKLGGKWDGTCIELPHGQWTNHLTGEVWREGRVEISTLLARFPVALLSREELRS